MAVLLRAFRAARDTLLGALLPCPACGVRPAGARGCCAPCRRLAVRPGRLGPTLWLGPYAGPLGRAVRALKYRGATRLAGWLATALAREVAAASWHPTVVCAVPLHPARHRERGYDQALLLARGAAAALGVPCRSLLARVRPTRPQARLSRAARMSNVTGAFVAAPVPGAVVLLVDDVLTTGATTAACRDALLAAGALEVRVAVIARSERSSVPVPPARHGPPPSRAHAPKLRGRRAGR
jgi:ComF family protein